MIQPVVLCGGSGTRLWPVSRRSYPKQFAELVSGDSLLALTLQRMAPLLDTSDTLVCVGSEEHQFMLSDAVARTVGRATIILEPVARNTTAAMVMAALHAPDPDSLQLFCPSDHHIPDVDAFKSMVLRGADVASQGSIVMFGVTPTHPSTAYGYIVRGQERALGGHRVAGFVEKPNASRASELIETGSVLWNAGIFLCKSKVLLQAAALHAPDILESCRRAMTLARAHNDFIYPHLDALIDCRGESIDIAVMERHTDLVVFPFEGAWSDVGSWNAVADLAPSDAQGNRIDGHGVISGSATRNYIHAPHRRVVAVGTDNLVIIDTPDAVLVLDRSSVEQVKDVVAQLERGGHSEATLHRRVVRPWGYFDSVERGPGFQVKRLHVNPLAALSLQMHRHRSEHWFVVRGTAEVTVGSSTFLLLENQSVDIPVGTLHRLHNPGDLPVELIEVQSGKYLGEDDIIRFDDAYGRKLHGPGSTESDAIGDPGAESVPAERLAATVQLV